MSEPHVVTALKRKRAELGGHAEHLRRELAQVRADLIHIDASLRVFGCEADPEEIPAKPYRAKPRLFANGELRRAVLDSMRTKPDGITVNEIAETIIEFREWVTDDRPLHRMICVGVRDVLGRLKRGGLAVPSAEGKGEQKIWRLVS